MFKLFTQRWFLVLLAILLLSLVIWYGGPYLALGSMKPLESVTGRLIAILVLVILWTLWVQVKQLRARQAADHLAQDVSSQSAAAKQAPAGPGAADAAQLKARFDEAIGALRASKGKAASLYELPWYIIIGPPGAGKTTAIANSGLNFPLSKKFGKEALRGVGGTRNCDWWFTDEAILLDTAGRYTTQDSDSASDQAGWIEFLHLLRKHRGRRPINGVIVAMSAPDLLSLGDSERRRHVEAVRRRLEELNHELKINLPLYFFLTKLDLVAGFTEFFDDLNQEGRAQVWGMTFPLQQSRAGNAAAQVATQFDQLVERLNSRLMLRLESERDTRRRAQIFTFPRQFAALRRALTDFTTETFGADASINKVQLRGVYFTSGTQEGTPVDRMLGTLARAFGLNMKGAVVHSGQGRAYFIQRLLKEILFKESGLAGVNQRMELRQALLNGAVYIGVCVVLIAGLIAFSISYQRNRAYLDDVGKATQVLKSVPAGDPARPLTASLERLDALGDINKVANAHTSDVPWSMRWGLYQGRSVANAAQDTYMRDLNGGLLPAVAQHFRDRLVNFAGEPDKLYEYLKAYLMLGMPQHLDAAQLGFIARFEWQRQFGGDPATLERVATHFNALIADPDRVRPAKLDDDVVERARNSLKQASLPVLMYSRLKLSYVDDTEHAIDISRQLGLGGDAVFARKSGVSLSQPMPGLYTKPAFQQISTAGQLELVKQFVSDNWVLGGDVAAITRSPQLSSQFMQLYEDDYIRQWDSLLADLTLRSTSSTQDAAQLWGLLGASTSPLKRLLELVTANTRLVGPPDKDSAAAKAKAALSGTLGTLGKVFGSEQQATTSASPGTRTTQHFESLHKLVAGSPAPIDATLQKFSDIQKILAEVNALGGPPPLETATKLSLALKDLETHAKSLPGPMDGIVARATGKGAAVASASIGSDFSARYRQQVVAECKELAAGKYPLAPTSTADLPLADFGRIFAPNGTFDAFFKNTMQSFVDTNRPVWRWKPEASAIGGAASVPPQFQRAQRVALTYFPAAAATPEVRFTVTPDFLDATATRMALEVDGQTLEYRHGPQRAVAMAWPGPSPGQAAISLEGKGGERPNIVEQGPWALYRLLGKAEIQVQSETRFLATFNLGGKSVRLIVQASSARNPFARDLLHGFDCQG